MLRTLDAARFLGVSAATLRKWRLIGKGPCFAKLGSAVVYDPAELRRWVADLTLQPMKRQARKRETRRPRLPPIPQPRRRSTSDGREDAD